MLLSLVWLLCLLFSSQTFAAAWTQGKGSLHFEHSFSRHFGSKKFATDYSVKLERLIRNINYLRHEEVALLDFRQTKMSYHAYAALKMRTRGSTARAHKMARYRKESYWSKSRANLEIRHQTDQQRKDVLRTLLYKSAPRLHYNASLEYGLTTNCTIGYKFMYDKFQSSFLEDPSSFVLDSYLRQKLIEFDSKVISIQPYARVKYCKSTEYGFGMDFLLGSSKRSKKQFGRIKMGKIFKNHCFGFYYPLSKSETEDFAEVKTENTIGKELESGLGFCVQHFWSYCVNMGTLASKFSCHRAQTCVYKKVGNCTINLGGFIESTKFHDSDHLLDKQRFYPEVTSTVMMPVRKKHKNTPFKKRYESIRTDLSSRNLFRIFNFGILGSISWIF